MARQIKWIPCPRCGGTGQYKHFGKCYLCNGTKKTTQTKANNWATKEGGRRWRGGGMVASLCTARRTVKYLGDTPDSTLYCYGKAGHDESHTFRQKASERNANYCEKPVLPIGADGTLPCSHLKNHSGECWVASNMLDSSTYTVRGRTRETQGDANTTTNATHEEPSAPPATGWDISQRNDLDALVALLKD